MSSTRPLISPTDPTLPAILEPYNINPDDLHALSRFASKAKTYAYCPYSQFRVGAALLSSNDDMVMGANVENASYPVGTCAERVALGTAVASRTKDEWDMKAIRALGVSSDISPPASPCGMCRQFIREFCALDMPVVMFDKDGLFWICKLEELLPLSFGPEALPPPKRDS